MGFLESSMRPDRVNGLALLLSFILFTCMMLILLLLGALYMRFFRGASSIRGLDDAAINRLPMFMHKKKSSVLDDDFRESECSICLGEYEDEEMIRVMPECGHSFHSDCVDEWLRSRSTCRLCRHSLDSSSTRISVTIS